MKNTKRLIKYISPFKSNLFGAIFSAFVGIALSLMVPILIGKGVDCITAKGDVDFARLFKVGAVLAICIVVSALFQWIMTYNSNKLSFKTVQKMRTEVFEKLTKVPLSYIDSTAHGDIINTVVTDIDIVSTGLLRHCDNTRYADIYVHDKLVYHARSCGADSPFVFCRFVYSKARAQKLRKAGKIPR